MGSEAVAISQELQAYDQLLTALLSDRGIVAALDRKLGRDSGLADRLEELMQILQPSQRVNSSQTVGKRWKTAVEYANKRN